MPKTESDDDSGGSTGLSSLGIEEDLWTFDDPRPTQSDTRGWPIRQAFGDPRPKIPLCRAPRKRKAEPEPAQSKRRVVEAKPKTMAMHKADLLARIDEALAALDVSIEAMKKPSSDLGDSVPRRSKLTPPLSVDDHG